MGQFSIRQVMMFTYKFFPNRFAYKSRDVLKKVNIRKQTKFDYRGKAVGTRFKVTTYSYPQYHPYRKGKKRQQRTIRHEYDIILDMAKLDLDSTDWKIRVGSFRRWVPQVKPSLIKSRKNPKGKYLSVGDWNSRVLGLNGDFYFRQATPFQRYGHLYGRLWHKAEESTTPFFGKHDIRLIQTLLKLGVFNPAPPRDNKKSPKK